MENQTLQIQHANPTWLKVLEVIAWIIFLGLCIEAGAILFKVFYTFTFNESASLNFIKSANLVPILNINKIHYFGLVSCINIIALLKAYMFYLIVHLISYKKFNFESPFQYVLLRFLKQIRNLAFSLGIITFLSIYYLEWLSYKNLPVPSILDLQFIGGDIWVFLGVILFVVAQFIKKGMDLQAEQDLTI